MPQRRNKYLYAILGSFFALPLLTWFGLDVLRWSLKEVWWLAVIGTGLISLVFVELDFRLNRAFYDYHDSKPKDEDRQESDSC